MAASNGGSVSTFAWLTEVRDLPVEIVANPLRADLDF
jgi:hypothetical protein